MASSFLTEFDLYLINQGSHYRIYDKLGAHVIEQDGVRGTSFAVWAPNARRLAVIGEFNGWNPDANLMNFHADCGVWECFVPGVLEGAHYKYHLVSNLHGYWVEKSDPYAFHAEMRPGTASRVFTLDGYQWGDAEWMASRHSKQGLQAPMSIYEVHLGSWRRVPDDNSRWLTYREMAETLPDYCADMGYTHVELMPVAEHPFDGSWGYQVTGYYAPTSRFGDPHDFMHLVDALHRKGIGVILDWVPGHFPRDFPALSFFDGTHLYEHEDPRKREHKDWDTLIFNYGRREVANFLLANALFWLEKYHIDGLRVDAVASMLYLDYSRKEGEWEPNHLGGRENLEAVDFLRRFNTKVYEEFPDVVTIAEESTAWPMVSRPTYIGGLGFGFKWDMGWMHDTLSYMSREPVHRRYHQNDLTFRGLYANTENFALPLSHDEVVHGKGSLINKMPGDYWQKFANLRLLFGYMYANTGKKLVFQGGEIAQWREWFEGMSVDWHLLDFPSHRGIQNWMRDINRLYVQNPAMHVWDCDPRGFEWIDCNDSDQSVVSLMRKGPNPDDTVIFGFNFTPVPRHNYRVGAPREGFWKEILNSDAHIYGGSGLGNLGGQWTSGEWVHNRPCSLSITLPPLGVVAFQRQEG